MICIFEIISMRGEKNIYKKQYKSIAIRLFPEQAVVPFFHLSKRALLSGAGGI